MSDVIAFNSCMAVFWRQEPVGIDLLEEMAQ